MIILINAIVGFSIGFVLGSLYKEVITIRHIRRDRRISECKIKDNRVDSYYDQLLDDIINKMEKKGLK